MSILKRLGKVFQAEAHSAVDKLEDPIKMTEQGIRDMKEDLKKAIEALAEVKALTIRAKNEAANYKAKAESYQNKAVALLKSAQAGKLAQAEADRLAAQALSQKNQMLQAYQQAMNNYQTSQAQVEKLETTIRQLKAKISTWENELKMLRARASVASATKKVNKQLAGVDYSDTVAMLERMKEKVDKEEAMSQAYAELAADNTSVDQEIDSVLEALGSDGNDELAALKAQISGELPDAKNEELPPKE